MDLTSDNPFWPILDGLPATYPPLETDATCDVAVIGAGITGCMVAQRLAGSGRSVIVLDRRDVASGSTSASTALLQYEIDVPLVEVSRKLGRVDAERAYRLSWDSIDALEELARRLDIDCGFRRTTSLYVASDDDKAALLEAEAAARNGCGLPVRLIGPGELADTYRLPGTAAIVSDQAACCDPYLFAHGLLARAVADGARVHDRTEVTSIECVAGGVRLATDRGPVVSARQVVVATGYEAQAMLDEKVVDLRSTYALVSQPLKTVAPWHADWMMWQAKDPYLYLRVTDDRRLLVGGEDDRFRNPARRDARLEAKTRRIEKQVREMLPDLDWEVEFSWAGTFGATDDGLAYIGATEEYPGCFFALGFGGNGITFSQVATDLLAELLDGREPPDARLFRFGR